MIDKKTTHDPPKKQLGPQKLKKDPKINSKSKVKIEGTVENKSCSTTWLDPKTFLEPYSDPKISPSGPQKVKKNRIKEN